MRQYSIDGLCVAVAGVAVGWHHLLTSARTEKTEVGFSFLVVSSRRSRLGTGSSTSVAGYS